jgi:5-methyltetrahydrofolate--homocysteine methyltransferase
MDQAVSAVRNAGLNGVKVIVGGAPITRVFAEEIGADGYAADAASAVDVALQLVQKA